MNGIFISIAIMFILAAFGAFIARIFRQPLIPAYILTGIFIGPAVLGLIQDIKLIKLLSEIGIAFLLFIVGLELDMGKIRSSGLVATVGGTLQMALLFLTGWVAAILVGIKSLEAVYIAIMLTFSSTFVVVKLLSDEKQLLSLHGRIAIGFLLLQDIAAILLLSVLGTLSVITTSFLFIALLKGALLLITAYLVSKLIFPGLFRFSAQSRELLFMLSLAVLFLFSLLAILLGFSVAIGAFLAGIAIANLPYNYEIGARIKPLRDFFATLFFVALGMEFTFFSLQSVWAPLIAFLLFTIFWKPLVTLFTCVIFGYSGRTGFQVAGALAQTSEFSLIIASQGLLLGHISQNVFGIVILVTMLSIGVSSYYVHYDAGISFKLRSMLKRIDNLRSARKIDSSQKLPAFDTLIIGCNRIGHGIVSALKKNNIFVIDHNPSVIARLKKDGVPCMYGDIGDVEILEHLNLGRTKMAVSTTSDIDINMLLLKYLKSVKKDIVMFLTANTIEDSLKLYDQGADYVVLPHFLGGSHVSVMLDETMKDFQALIRRKISHIKELKHRMDIGHRHPED